MRMAASCAHPLQVRVAPRGALTWRLRMLIVDLVNALAKVEI
jgi:hypothetical protein